MESKTGACEAPMEFEGKAPKAVSRRRVIEGAVALGVLAAFGGTVRATPPVGRTSMAFGTAAFAADAVLAPALPRSLPRGRWMTAL